jgi:hypothetical protein
MLKFDTRSDVQPSAVMSDAELQASERLPQTFNLNGYAKRLIKACGPESGRSMQDILNDVLARQPGAEL